MLHPDGVYENANQEEDIADEGKHSELELCKICHIKLPVIEELLRVTASDAHKYEEEQGPLEKLHIELFPDHLPVLAQLLAESTRLGIFNGLIFSFQVNVEGPGCTEHHEAKEGN